MIALKDFSELLEVLYTTPLHPEQWGVFLDLLCEHTRSRSSFLVCADSWQGLSVRAQGGVRHSPEAIAEYAEKYSGRDPYLLPLVRSGRTGLIDPDTLLPRAALEASDMYRYLNAPRGYRYPGLVALSCTLRRLEVISFWRSGEEGYLDQDSMDLLELLIPHVRSALEIRYVLGVTGQRMADAEVMADASSTAAFLLSPRGEIRHCNSAARGLLQAGDALMESKGVLTAAVARSRPALRELLQRGAGVGAARAAYGPLGALSRERSSGGRPLQLLASPVPPARGANQEPTLLLLVTDPDRPVHLRDDLMRSQYGFTRAETEVANGLLTGYSLEEIAALRDVSVATVRDQLKSLFGKTGTKRQAELVALLANLPQPPFGG